MDATEYDLIVVGGGSGGVAAARRAAEYGARVAICEKDRFGGTCVHRGCVPKKLLVYAASFAEAFELSAGYGWERARPAFDWAHLIRAKDQELDRLAGFYHRSLDEAGVERIAGMARLVDGHTVEVDGRRLQGQRILLAVGGRPWKPDAPGLEEHAITSDEAFHIKTLPRRALLIGSGYIGAEFAGIFNALGVETTLLFRSPMVLPGFDPDVRSSLQQEMEKRGVRFMTGRRVEHLERRPDSLVVTTSEQERFEVDLVLCATGRLPNTRDVGLEQVGVELSATGGILVDGDYRSSVDSIYAVGDCIERIELTPVAIAEGRALAETLFNQNPTSISYENVPTAVFSQPPVGAVGLTQQQALERSTQGVDVYRTRFRQMLYTLPDRPYKVMLKLLVDRATDRVLGCHMVGEGAPELVQAVAVALTCRATKADFDHTLAVHPTTAEELVLLRKPVEKILPAGVAQ